METKRVFPRVIAIDFDGTVVTNDFPRVGKDIGAAPVLKRLVEAGHKLVLFTMRSNKPDVKIGEYNTTKSGNYLDHAVDWFKANEIPLFGINVNPDQKSWTESSKAFAELYIDDASLGCPLKKDGRISDRPFIDWKLVETLLENNNFLLHDCLTEMPAENEEDTEDNSDVTVPVLITKVHDSIEGRYDLNSKDFYYIHRNLWKLYNKSISIDPVDVEDLKWLCIKFFKGSSWVKPLDMYNIHYFLCNLQ